MALEVRDEVGAHVPDEVHAAGLELRHLRRHLRHGPDDEHLERGLAAPVLVEGLEADVLVALPLDELPGPRADRLRGPKASSPTFSTCFFGMMGKNTMRSRSSGNGLSVTTWTVSAATMRTSLMARMLPYWGDFFFGSSTRSKEYFTSSAVITSPL